jgi:DNA modification methylase
VEKKTLLGVANALTIPLPDNSVHCAVGSPPYYGLREYEGVGPTVWPSVTYRPVPGMEPITLPGDVECGHVWGEHRVQYQRGKVGRQSTLKGGPQSGGDGRVQEISQGQWCQMCGAWQGTLGNEPTLEMFIGHLVAIFREVRRVLRDDGTMWLNLGDSYVSQGGPVKELWGDVLGQSGARRDGWGGAGQSRRGVPGLKPKDLMMAPHRVALALQADGWWVRCDNVWAKGRDGDVGDAGYGAAMPMSRTDAPTHTHEYVFQCSPSERYYYDAVAVRQHWIDWDESNPTRRHKSHHLRSVWLLGSGGGYSGAHFAPFPLELASLCISAGTSERGVCSECGAPWERVVEKQTENRSNATLAGTEKIQSKGLVTSQVRDDHDVRKGPCLHTKTIGWRPTCDCDAGDPVPAVALDPFVGSGTTLLEARRLGRRGIGLDASRTYLRREATPRLELDRWKAWEGGGNGRDHDVLDLEELPMFRGVEV